MTSHTIGQPSNRGIAAFEALDTYDSAFPLVTAQPAPMSRRLKVAASQTLARYQVVGINANGEIVAAKWDAVAANRIRALGVMDQAITTDADDEVYANVWYTGHWNIDFLVWGATYTTDAQKLSENIGNVSPGDLQFGQRGNNKV